MHFLYFATIVAHALQLTIDVTPHSGGMSRIFTVQDRQANVLRVRNRTSIIPVTPSGIYEIVSVLHPEAGATAEANPHTWAVICEREKSEDCDLTPCWTEAMRVVCCDPPDQLQHRTMWKPRGSQLLIVLWPVTDPDRSPRPTSAHCSAFLTRRAGLDGDGWEVCTESPSGTQTVAITKLSDH